MKKKAIRSLVMVRNQLPAQVIKEIYSKISQNLIINNQKIGTGIGERFAR